MEKYSHKKLSSFFSKALKYHENGDLENAEKYYSMILSHIPNHADTLHYLGLIKHKKKNNIDAISLIEKAIRYAPNDLSMSMNLAIIYEEENQFDKALLIYQNIIEKDSKQAMAHYGLAKIYKIQKDTNNFILHSKKAHLLDPRSTKILILYASALSKELKIYDSINILKLALKDDPTNTITLSNLIATLYSIGNIKEAITYNEQYNKIEKTNPSGINQYLFNCNYDPHLSLTSLFNKHKERAHSLPALSTNTITPTINKKRNRKNNKKIKIGYCSSDFRFHSVAFFFQPIIENYDHKSFETFCYYNNSEVDDLTLKIQSSCDNWRDIHHLTDQQVVDVIQNDNIDILVDLSGYSAGNRIGVFSNRVAPIQISYLGYPNTTGLTTVDYRIVDNITDPIGLTEDLNTENLIRMEECFICYSPRNNCPAIKPPPFMKNKHITFGSFNNMAKINNDVIKLWSDILITVKDSKLLIKSSVFCDPEIIKFTLKRFKEFNILPSQLIFKSHKTDFESHMETYNEIDIALDPFPYNGTTTTCEALWMGVPVITLLGKSHISRVSASILHSLSLNQLICDNKNIYKRVAKELAHNTENIFHFRQSIRQKMNESEFTNGIVFTQSLENIYRDLQENINNEKR